MECSGAGGRGRPGGRYNGGAGVMVCLVVVAGYADSLKACGEFSGSGGRGGLGFVEQVLRH